MRKYYFYHNPFFVLVSLASIGTFGEPEQPEQPEPPEKPLYHQESSLISRIVKTEVLPISSPP